MGKGSSISPVVFLPIADIGVIIAYEVGNLWAGVIGAIIAFLAASSVQIIS